MTRKACPFVITMMLMLSPMLALGLIPVTSASAASSANLIFPAGIKYYVPITLTNSQSSPTPAPFQQMINVDSSSYSNYEASNLQNVEFFNSDGSLIPSWLESGNNNAAQHTIYWLDLASGIEAGSSVTVYMGFASPSTNLMNAQTTGEAPQLSSSYGQYDDGGIVFPIFYQNFAGASCPFGWTCTGVTVNDGVSIPNQSYITSSSVYGGNTNQILDFYGNFPLATNNHNAVFGYSTSDSGVSNPTSIQAAWDINTQGSGAGYAFGIVSNAGPYQIVNSIFTTGTNIYTVYWPSSNTVYFSYDYGNVAAAPTSTACSCQIPIGGASTQGQGVTIGPFNWVRLRAYPPGGIMPAESLGTITPGVTASVVCSPSPVVLGSSTVCTSTMTGNSPTGTMQWSSSGSGNFSQSSCTLSSGSCQVAYAPSDASSPVNITASYSGDVNNQAVSGSFSLTISKATSTTTITCTPSPISIGSSTMCTATEAGHSPSGIVTWASSGVANFSPASSCNLSGQSCSVTYTPSSLSSPVTITATYAGDSQNSGSSGTFSLTVAKAIATVLVVCSPSTILTGSGTTCTVTVHGYSPSGSVTFSASGKTGTFNPPAGACTLASDSCSVTFTDSTPGSSEINGSYGGDVNNMPGSGTFLVTVVQASTTTSPTSATTTSTAAVSSSTSPTLSSSTSLPSSSIASSTSTGGGGIPEFPYEGTALFFITALMLVSYVVVRSHRGRAESR